MSKTAISITAYCIYLGTAGVGMALIPNVLLGLVGHPLTDQVWPRLFGSLSIILSVKGIHGARTEDVSGMQLDVITRTCFSIFLTILWLIGKAEPILMIFAVIDFAGSVWTQYTIFKAKKAETV